ncbi:MAG: tetratricopeptide repeat protein [Planctomycetes bacterium]|nr:tetratricopeptide repeat protein [Planctomycetota bacterium]
MSPPGALLSRDRTLLHRRTRLPAVAVSLFIGAEAILRLVGALAGAAPPTLASPEVDGAVLCYGDSFTWGFGADEPSRQSYPARLATLLGPGARVTGRALPGRSSAEVLDQMAADLSVGRPRCAVVLVGMNNVWKRARPARADLAGAGWASGRNVFEDLRLVRLARYLAYRLSDSERGTTVVDPAPGERAPRLDGPERRRADEPRLDEVRATAAARFPGVFSRESPPEEARALFVEGFAAFDAGDFERASAAFRAVAALDAADADFLYHLGLSEQRCGRLSLARECQETARRAAPDGAEGAEARFEIDVALGFIDLDSGRPAEARQWFARLHAARPDHPHAALGLASAAAAAGDFAAQRATLADALRANPQSADLMVEMGHALLRAGEVAAARAQYQAAQALEPSNAAALYGLGQTLLAEGHPQEALVPLAAAVTADPENDRARFSLGYALAALGRHGEAREHLAAAFERCGDFGEFLSHFKKGFAGRPDDLRRDLARYLAGVEREKGAAWLEATGYRAHLADLFAAEAPFLRDDLAAAAALCRRRGVALVLLTYPTAVSGVNPVIRAAAAAAGVRCVDLEQEFRRLAREHPAAEPLFREGDRHCTAVGYERMAEVVARGLP